MKTGGSQGTALRDGWTDNLKLLAWPRSRMRELRVAESLCLALRLLGFRKAGGEFLQRLPEPGNLALTVGKEFAGMFQFPAAGQLIEVVAFRINDPRRVRIRQAEALFDLFPPG